MSKKLTRSRDEKWLGGVCGGIAAYTGIDVTLIRLVLAICTVLGAGSLVLAYVVAWFLIPVESGPAVWADATDAPATASEPAPPSA
jgi:phage shock protein C